MRTSNHFDDSSIMALNNLTKIIGEKFSRNLRMRNFGRFIKPDTCLVQPVGEAGRALSQFRHVPEDVLKPMYVNQTTPILRPVEIEIKTDCQIRHMRKACGIARHILNSTAQHIQVGVTTNRLDEIAHTLCLSHHVYPSPLGYRGYPKSVCTSVNEVACHGIPDDRPLHDGDILNIDVTIFCEGYHGDVSETYVVGSVDLGTQRLIDVARQCRDESISVCKPGARFCDIGNTISHIAGHAGYSVIPDFCGHGIGSFFHGPPDIIHIAYEENDRMQEGMTFTVEPVISEGCPSVRILSDGWTAVSVDQSRSAQFEHTVLVTKDGVDILTL